MVKKSWKRLTACLLTAVWVLMMNTIIFAEVPAANEVTENTSVLSTEETAQPELEQSDVTAPEKPDTAENAAPVSEANSLSPATLSAPMERSNVVKVSNEDELTQALQNANNSAPQEEPVVIALTNDIVLKNNATPVDNYYFSLTGGANVHLTSTDGNAYTIKFDDSLRGTEQVFIMFRLDGSSLTFSNVVLDCNGNGDDGLKSMAVQAEKKSRFVMNDGTKIMNASSGDAAGGGVITVKTDSDFIMNGGEISGNANKSLLTSSVIRVSNSRFVMNDGIITDNVYRTALSVSRWGYSGIVCVGNTSLSDGDNAYKDVPTTFTMNGGTICNNTVIDGYGGAISCSANGPNGRVAGPVTVTINDGLITGNKARGGGAISTSYSDTGENNHCLLEINGGEITNNRAEMEGDYSEGGGAITVYKSNFIMRGGRIADNYSDLSGGAIQLFYESNMEMYGGTIENNVADAHAGAICVAAVFSEDASNASSLKLDGGTICNNVANCNWSAAEHQDDPFAPGGGAIYLHGNNQLYISGNTVISGNRTENYGSGGGVYGCFGSTIEMEQGRIEENISVNDGGGIYLDGTGSYEGYTHSYGDGSNGTGSLLLLKGGCISGNTAVANGGGIYIAGKSTTYNAEGKFLAFRGGLCKMDGGVITANTAGDMGGGVYLENDPAEESAENAARFIMTDGALYFNVAGENGNTSTGEKDAGAELYSEGGKASFTVPSAEQITAYLQDSTHTYVPEADRKVWFTNWYDDYSDQDGEYGKGDSVTWETGRNTGRYMSSKVLDRMVYVPEENDHARSALILDRDTNILLEKTTSGEGVVPGEVYTFQVRMENLPDTTLAGTRYPVVLTTGADNEAVGTLPNGRQYLTFGEDGTASVRLAAGDSLEIGGLPAGTVFHFTETDAGSATGFSAEVTQCENTAVDEAGRSVSGRTQSEWMGETSAMQAVVRMDNNYSQKEAPASPSNTTTSTPRPETKTTRTVADTEVKPTAIPQTGDTFRAEIWMTVWICSAGVMGLLLAGKHSKKGKR